MKIYRHLMTCPVCGHLSRYHPQRARQALFCTHCRSLIWRSSLIPHALLLPLTLTALIALALACYSPVMMIQAYGMHNALSLWQTVNAVVDHGDMPLLALCVTVLLVSAPFMQLFLLLRVLLLLHGNHHAADVAFTIKALRWVRPWCMADVAILGFVVSAVKLSSQFAVEAGPGGWALVTAVGLSIVLANQHPHRYWLRLSPANTGSLT